MKGMIVVSNHNADFNEVWNRDLCAVEVESTNKQSISLFRHASESEDSAY